MVDLLLIRALKCKQLAIVSAGCSSVISMISSELNCPFLTLSYQCGRLTTCFCEKAQEKLTYPHQSYTIRNVRFVETQLWYKLRKLAELLGISANTTVHVLNDRCLVFAALQRCLE